VPPRSSERPQVSAVDAGLRLLAWRAHSRVELRRKLSRRGYDEDEVQRAESRLAELGYLDDAAFAEGHVRRRGVSLGPRALSSEMAARGVDRQVADKALAAFDREAQFAAATRLAERLCARGLPPGYKELLDSVGAKLVRRGFSPSVARAACQAVWTGAVGTPGA